MSGARRAIFHLSFPVTSLAASLDFYETCFGAQRGRDAQGWSDVILFGHQLTLHEQPAQVLAREARGVRHFGAIVGWPELEALRERVAARGVAASFVLRDAGLPGEHAKLLLEDPDANLIEIKAYRSLASISDGL
jgi:hypothetical protein